MPAPPARLASRHDPEPRGFPLPRSRERHIIGGRDFRLSLQAVPGLRCRLPQFGGLAGPLHQNRDFAAAAAAATMGVGIKPKRITMTPEIASTAFSTPESGTKRGGPSSKYMTLTTRR